MIRIDPGGRETVLGCRRAVDLLPPVVPGRMRGCRVGEKRAFDGGTHTACQLTEISFLPSF